MVSVSVLLLLVLLFLMLVLVVVVVVLVKIWRGHFKDNERVLLLVIIVSLMFLLSDTSFVHERHERGQIDVQGHPSV